jgi:transcriptional regulator with XRE-family HTH domain
MAQAAQPGGALGARIAQARLTRGAARGKAMTQTELARLVGVTPATVSQWESGSSKPDAYDLLPRVAAALGVTAQWLAWGENARSTDEIDIVDEAHDRPLSDAAIERARKAVAALKGSGAASPTRKRGNDKG